MANRFSAVKRVRQEKRRTVVNRRNLSRLRRQMRAFRHALQSGNPSAASSLFSPTIRVIDRAVQKGVIKKNAAARYKSRLTIRFHALSSAPTPASP